MSLQALRRWNFGAQRNDIPMNGKPPNAMTMIVPAGGSVVRYWFTIITLVLALIHGEHTWSMTAREDTVVSLDRAVHFAGAEDRDVSVPSGKYRVETESGAQWLRLVPLNGAAPMILRAESVTHTETLDHMLAISVLREDETLHLVLLSPGGQGLEAVGSYSGLRSRGVLSQVLTSDELKLYVALKLTQDQQQKSSSPDAGVQARQEQIRNLLTVMRGQPGGPDMIAAAQRRGAPLPGVGKDGSPARASASSAFSVTLTPRQPRRPEASLTFAQAVTSQSAGDPSAAQSLSVKLEKATLPAGPPFPTAAVSIKVPRNGWYLFTVKVKALSKDVHAILGQQRVVKTLLPGTAGKSAEVSLHKWEHPTQPGEETLYPALVELKAGEYELLWKVSDGGVEFIEAVILSL